MFQTFVLYFSSNTVTFSTVSSLINFSIPFCRCRVGVAVTTLSAPLSPGFKSRRRRQMWVSFVVAGSLPCSERFFTGYSGFALSKNQHIQILIRPGIRQTKNHYVDVLHLNRHLVVYLFIIYLSKSIIVKNLLSKILSFLCNSFPLSFPSLSPCGVGENPEGSDK